MVATKKIAIVLAVLLGLLFPVFAGAGVSITPSAGDYTFKSGGGRIDFIVTNYGSEASVFYFSFSGEAAQLVTADKSQVTIAPGASERISLTVGSGATGASYPLLVSAVSTAPSGATAGVSSSVSLIFTGEAGTSNYAVSTIPAIKTAENNLTSRLFTFFAAALLIGLAYYLIKTRGPWKE
jgi:hypothetical protein